jgi:hypothetical protein
VSAVDHGFDLRLDPHVLNEQLKLIEKESILSKKRPLEKLQNSETDIVMDMLEELSEKY